MSRATPQSEQMSKSAKTHYGKKLAIAAMMGADEISTQVSLIEVNLFEEWIHSFSLKATKPHERLANNMFVSKTLSKGFYLYSYEELI